MRKIDFENVHTKSKKRIFYAVVPLFFYFFHTNTDISSVFFDNEIYTKLKSLLFTPRKIGKS